MNYDSFVNEVINHFTDEGLLSQPRPIVIDGKTYFDEVWFVEFNNSSNVPYGNLCVSKVVEKTENTNPVLAMCLDERDSMINYVYTSVGYANDIGNFYPVKVNFLFLNFTLDVNTDTILYTTINNTNYELNSNSYSNNGYPLKDNDATWSSSSAGFGSFVKRSLVSEGARYWKNSTDFVTSTALFKNTYEAYKYFVNGQSEGDFSPQTTWNVYVDPRHSDGNYLDPNIKIVWHNELLDEFLSAGGDGSGYSVKVWGGIPKLKSDASGGMECQTIELGEYDYSTGNLLTSYSGVYSDVSNTYGTDILHELFHGKVCYILFSVYKDGEQCSSLCYISCKNKVPDTQSIANVVDYGQVGSSFGVLIDNNIDIFDVLCYNYK